MPVSTLEAEELRWLLALLAHTENVPLALTPLAGRRFVLCERMPDGSLRILKRLPTRDNPPPTLRDGRTTRR
jgi:hypothetical protein